MIQVHKKTAHVDLNIINLDNVTSVNFNSLPAVGEHLTAKNFVNEAIPNSVHDSSLLR